eukprot:maker-scaffold270_size230592-snap-gene-1.20 protein:Tk10969 transcript:maker-scaffold270_size230592-snap-gene-1.20-mRNA-1 annotation:"GG19859"
MAPPASPPVYGLGEGLPAGTVAARMRHFRAMRRECAFSDVFLYTSDHHSISAHQAVLAVHSSWLARLFAYFDCACANPTCGQHTPAILRLILPEVSMTVVELFLDLCYLGQVVVDSRAQYDELASLAGQLGVSVPDWPLTPTPEVGPSQTPWADRGGRISPLVRPLSAVGAKIMSTQACRARRSTPGPMGRLGLSDAPIEVCDLTLDSDEAGLSPESPPPFADEAQEVRGLPISLSLSSPIDSQGSTPIETDHFFSEFSHSTPPKARKSCLVADDEIVRHGGLSAPLDEIRPVGSTDNVGAHNTPHTDLELDESLNEPAQPDLDWLASPPRDRGRRLRQAPLKFRNSPAIKGPNLAQRGQKRRLTPSGETDPPKPVQARPSTSSDSGVGRRRARKCSALPPEAAQGRGRLASPPEAAFMPPEPVKKCRGRKKRGSQLGPPQGQKDCTPASQEDFALTADQETESHAERMMPGSKSANESGLGRTECQIKAKPGRRKDPNRPGRACQKLQCFDCQVHFHSVSALKSHIVTDHFRGELLKAVPELDQLVKCPECCKKFANIPNHLSFFHRKLEHVMPVQDFLSLHRASAQWGKGSGGPKIITSFAPAMTSLDCERAFSTFKDLLSSQKNRFTEDHLKDRMLIQRHGARLGIAASGLLNH